MERCTDEILSEVSGSESIKNTPKVFRYQYGIA